MMFGEVTAKFTDLNTWSQVSVEHFAILFPICHSDSSKHKKFLNNALAYIQVG